MGNRKITTKTIKGKDKLHPGSRKAGQVTRANLRTVKLQSQTKQRRDHAESKLQRPLFFLYSLSSSTPISLTSFKALITDVYIARHDARIAELVAERRSGRPKSKEQLDLEELKRRERAEYESGMEVPDLTHGPTVRLMHSWLESETTMQLSHLDLLRQIRVSPNGDVIVTKPGKAEEMGLASASGGMDVEVGDGEGDRNEDGDDWTTLAKDSSTIGVAA